MKDCRVLALAVLFCVAPGPGYGQASEAPEPVSGEWSAEKDGLRCRLVEIRRPTGPPAVILEVENRGSDDYLLADELPMGRPFARCFVTLDLQRKEPADSWLSAGTVGWFGDLIGGSLRLGQGETFRIRLGPRWNSPTLRQNPADAASLVEPPVLRATFHYVSPWPALVNGPDDTPRGWTGELQAGPLTVPH